MRARAPPHRRMKQRWNAMSARVATTRALCSFLTLLALCPGYSKGDRLDVSCRQSTIHALGIERTPGASTVLLRIAMHRPLQMPGKKKASASGSPTCARSR